MAITKVAAVSGTAEVLGSVLEFTFADGALTLKGVGYGDVTRILDTLASGVMWDERPPMSNGAAAKFPEVAKPEKFLPVTPVETKPEPAVPASPKGELPLGNTSTVKGGNGTPEPALITADSLMKVLTILKGKGFGEWKPLLDECERIRPEVPVLKKIADADFKDRILRVASTKLQMAVPDDA